MESLFVREAFALFIFILFFCVLYISKQRDEPRLILLYIILIPAIVFGHHFTSFMLIILLGIYIVVSKAVPYFYRKDEKLLKRLSGRINIKTIFLVLLSLFLLSIFL